MANDNRGHRVLVLTVGTGNPNDLEGSLYAPLQKSMDTGSWRRVVLFPSKGTRRQASELKRRYEGSGLTVTIFSLPEPGMEDDAD